MKGKDPFLNVQHLIGGVGFSNKDELGSFCLAVGLFHEDVPPRDLITPRKWDPSNYNIWPIAQIISYRRDPSIKDITEMKRYLYPYLISGIDLVARRVKGKSGINMLDSLSDLIPP